MDSAAPPHQGHPAPYDTYSGPPSQAYHFDHPLHHQPQPSFALSSAPASYQSNPSPASAYSIPNPAAAPAQAPAPAVNPYIPYPYAPHGGYSVGPAAVGNAGVGPASYYYEGTGAESHGFAVMQYGADTTSYPSAPPRPSSGLYPPPITHVVPSQSRKESYYKSGAKKASKLTKVSQSASCAVCKIECTSQEVLNNHKLGKKHKKNLQKLQDLITPKPQQVTTKPVEQKEPPPIPEQVKAAGSKKAKRKAASEEDVETKKKKILESGAEPTKVMACTVCNVVVNSKVVYESHIAGSKHVAMLKKQEEAAKVL